MCKNGTTVDFLKMLRTSLELVSRSCRGYVIVWFCLQHDIKVISSHANATIQIHLNADPKVVYADGALVERQVSGLYSL